MKVLLLTVFATLFSLNSARSSPLIQSYLTKKGGCDRVFDERIQDYNCIEHTAPVKRTINEFRGIAMGVKNYLNTISLISDSNKAKIDTFFSKADTNKDKLISKEEMTAYADS
jgi:hypothetical protein